jgi:hypothetical protein
MAELCSYLHLSIDRADLAMLSWYEMFSSQSSSSDRPS